MSAEDTARSIPTLSASSCALIPQVLIAPSSATYASSSRISHPNTSFPSSRSNEAIVTQSSGTGLFPTKILSSNR